MFLDTHLRASHHTRFGTLAEHPGLPAADDVITQKGQSWRAATASKTRERERERETHTERNPPERKPDLKTRMHRKRVRHDASVLALRTAGSEAAASPGFRGGRRRRGRAGELLSTCVRQHVHPQPHAVLEVFATVLAAVASLLVVQPPAERQTLTLVSQTHNMRRGNFGVFFLFVLLLNCTIVPVRTRACFQKRGTLGVLNPYA